MELRIPEPFLQKHLVAFQKAFQGMRKDEDVVLSVYRGFVIKAAMEAGWMDEADVEEMEASEVVNLSAEIQEKIAEATTVSKN